jgi:hypothetical protein
MVGTQFVTSAGRLVEHRQATHVPRAVCIGLDQHVGHALLETDLTAERDDLLAQPLYDLHQLEGADVRVRHVQDLGRRAGVDELLHHLAAQVARILDLAVELAVGEGAGAAFAELHVRFRVEHVLAPQAPGVLGPFAHVLAALQHDGVQAHLRQQQCREDAARAEADHHWPELGRYVCVVRMPVHHVRAAHHVRVAGETGQQRIFVDAGVKRQVDDVDLHQLGLARVEAALEDGVAGDGRSGQAELALDGFGKGLLGVVERQLDFGDSDHVSGAWPPEDTERPPRGAAIRKAMSVGVSYQGGPW